MSAATELLVLALFVVPVGAGLWSALDANQFSEVDFTAAGTSKSLWVAVPLAGLFVCLLGLVAAALWFLVYRRRVVAAAEVRRAR